MKLTDTGFLLEIPSDIGCKNFDYGFLDIVAIDVSINFRIKINLCTYPQQ
jgi:hypothetical protein